MTRRVCIEARSVVQGNVGRVVLLSYRLALDTVLCVFRRRGVEVIMTSVRGR
jgi:hypothetical protein